MENNSTPLEAFFKQIYLPTRPNTSPRTVKLYGYSILKFKKYLGETPTLADLTDEIVGGYLQSILAAGLSGASVNKQRDRLLAMWRHARLAGFLTTGPTIKKLAVARRIPKALTVEELMKLQASFDELRGSTGGIPNADFLRACFAIQFATAERIGAVIALTFADVQGDVITFRSETRKGGCTSLVKRVPPWVLADIDRIRSPQRERIFPISETNKTKIQTLYARLFKCAGVERPKGKSSHLLRSTHATMLWLAGGDPTASLGHSSREVTRKHYLDPRFKPDDSGDFLPSLDD